MTLQEFSVEFDILYNNVSSNQAPGLTEYEKSVFLTQAQDAIVLDLYKGTGGDSFESTEEVTRYLSTLVKATTLVEDTEVNDLLILNSKRFKFKEEDQQKLMFILYYSAQIYTDDEKTQTRDVLVVPTTLDRVYKEMQNPFKKSNNNRVLALSSEDCIDLITDKEVKEFYIKYLRKPLPIILPGSLEGGLSINEITEDNEYYANSTYDSTIELPVSTHRAILLRAIQLAQMVWKTS